MGPVETIFEKGEVDLYDGKVDKYSSQIDLKAFYNELHDLLVEDGWGDTWEPGFNTDRPKKFGGGNVLVAKGEFVDAGAYFNRTRDMFEKHFMISDKGVGKEIEIEWEAISKLSLSHFGDARVKFKFAVVNRFMTDNEVEINGKKVTLQGGTWEFRNKITYLNPVVEKRIDPLPILGKWNWTKELYFKYIYAKYVVDDVNYIMGKIKPKIYGLIEKHFSLKSA